MIHLVAAAALAVFNLTCTIDLVIDGNNPFPRHLDQAKIRTFRIDLNSRRYCEADCSTTNSLDEFSDTIIYLKFTNLLKRFEAISINRETGNFDDMSEIGSIRSDQMGKCEPAPFTGFPARKF